MYKYPMHNFTSNLHNSFNQLNSHHLFILQDKNSSIILALISSSITITQFMELQDHHTTRLSGFYFKPSIQTNSSIKHLLMMILIHTQVQFFKFHEFD
ncbi:hypothetical protein HanXRQr2_Chr04g0171761 [Helianthus annuus]|uniref:Uncharacterized protein n=1 Tax=Helianthus annuus TaxID=4232 RepID=A0A9K3J914_HELAN|nr:hypothetical protein HanXRQr2_Chr04g0171761 [Helianthus annuus]KAJ0931729.1 hypothetical protein HanPSC8_Chr04g0165321 [Helianthus annuus]